MSRISVLAGAVALFLFGASAFLLAGGREEKPSTKPEAIAAPAAEPIAQAKPLARMEPEPVEQTPSVNPKNPKNPENPTTPVNPVQEPVAPGSARESSRSKLPVLPSSQRPLPSPPVAWEAEEDFADPEAQAAAVDAADLVHELMKKRR